MAGGAAGTPNQMGSASPAAPSQASQYSGSYAQPSMPTYQSQPAQSYQPQFGGGYGQGYGSPSGGMDDGFRSPFAPPVQSSPFGGMGGMYGPQPQYGYGGMGNQFMGGGMGGFDPYGGRPAHSFGGRDMYGPRGGFGGMMGQMYGGERGYGHGGFDPRYMDVKPNPEVVQQSTTQPTNEQASTPPQGLAELQRMMPPRWMNRRRGPYFGPEY